MSRTFYVHGTVGKVRGCELIIEHGHSMVALILIRTQSKGYHLLEQTPCAVFCN